MILSRPDGGAQENLLRATVGPVESFSGYGRGYKHPVLDRPLTQGVRWRTRRSGGGVTSNRAFGQPIAYLSARCAYNRKRPEAWRPTGAAGCAIPSRVGAVACASGHAAPRRDGRPRRSPAGLLASHRHASRPTTEGPSVNNYRIYPPPRNFTHLVLGENPQLAAPVAVQFQNSAARLPQSSLKDSVRCFRTQQPIDRLLN